MQGEFYLVESEPGRNLGFVWMSGLPGENSRAQEMSSVLSGGSLPPAGA
ncbi:hypothetical protein ACH4Y0_37985 [Streptomyces sp. NPDC020707]